MGRIARMTATFPDGHVTVFRAVWRHVMAGAGVKTDSGVSGTVDHLYAGHDATEGGALRSPPPLAAVKRGVRTAGVEQPARAPERLVRGGDVVLERDHERRVGR